MKAITLKLLETTPPFPGLFDSHIHLDSQNYEEDLEDCLSRAQQMGVEGHLLPATNWESAARIASLCRSHGGLYGALGIHPHQAAEFEPTQSSVQVSALLSKSSWVAIGETGLELHYDFCPLAQQLDSLRFHLEVARDTGLPLILHCRKAEEELFQVMQSVGKDLPGVVHCFTGGWEWAQKFLDLGLYLGIGGLVTLPKAHEVHEVATRVPGDRWLLETDGPYLSPVPFRGYRNESALLPWVIRRLAELRQTDAQALVNQARENAFRLFRLTDRELHRDPMGCNGMQQGL